MVTRHTAQSAVLPRVTVGSAWRPASWETGAGYARCCFRPRPDPGPGPAMTIPPPRPEGGRACAGAAAFQPDGRRHCSCAHPSPARRGRLRVAPQRCHQGSSHLLLQSREPSLAVGQRGRPRLRRWSLRRGRAAPRGRRSAHRAVWSLGWGSESAGLGRGRGQVARRGVCWVCGLARRSCFSPARARYPSLTFFSICARSALLRRSPSLPRWTRQRSAWAWSASCSE